MRLRGATAGGLVFTGEGNGNFNAYESQSGKLLWQYHAGAGCNAPPVCVELDGEQVVEVCALPLDEIALGVGFTVLGIVVAGLGYALLGLITPAVAQRFGLHPVAG